MGGGACRGECRAPWEEQTWAGSWHRFFAEFVNNAAIKATIPQQCNDKSYKIGRKWQKKMEEKGCRPPKDLLVLSKMAEMG